MRKHSFLGHGVRHTNAVHPDHIFVQPGHLFIGRGSAAAYYAIAVTVEEHEQLYEAFFKSAETRKSVKLEPCSYAVERGYVV